MDVGRFCGVLGTAAETRHQRIASYLKDRCEVYPGMGFTPREEWLAEQTLLALRAMLSQTRCTPEERRALEEFLDLAAEELPGPP